jgi:hypothetical protein
MRRRTIAKRKLRKRHGKCWEQFISHLESGICKIKPHMSKLQSPHERDIKETANINPGPSKETFLHHYKE